MCEAEYRGGDALTHVRAALSGDAAADGADSDAMALAMSAVRAFTSGADGRLPTPSEIDAYAGADEPTRELAAAAAALAERAAVLGFDAPALAAWIDVHRGLVKDGEAGPKRASLMAAQAWVSLLSSDPAGVEARTEELRAFASSNGLAPETIEAAVLKALASELAGDAAEAVRHARRASRMARTESLPQEEYLANLVLARLRRRDGKPHLAARIVSSLLRVATGPWRPWMRWELTLAGAPLDDEAPARTSDADAAVRALADLTGAAGRGARAEYVTARGELVSRVAAFEAIAAEAIDLCALLDGEGGSEAVRAFREGESHDVPAGLAGWAVAGGASEAAWVVAAPKRRLRVLAPGVALHGTHARLPEVRRQARTDATIAELLLAGPEGLAEPDLFLRVYGFAYQAALHQGTRDVLYHRVRGRLEGLGALERNDGRARITHADGLVAPDPRASPPPEHELLVMIASSGHISAKEAAEALGIPVRTAQDALRRMVDDGACRAEKKGRKLVYHVEDTTFLEPTKV